MEQLIGVGSKSLFPEHLASFQRAVNRPTIAQVAVVGNRQDEACKGVGAEVTTLKQSAVTGLAHPRQQLAGRGGIEGNALPGRSRQIGDRIQRIPVVE